MTTPGHQPQVSPLGVCIAGALSLAVAMGIGRFAFTPMLPLMIQERQIDVAMAGWVAAANYAGYLLGALSAARVPLAAARLGFLSLALTAILTAAMALPGSASLWVVLRLLAGVCSAWAFVSTSVWCLGVLARLGRPAWGSALYAGVGAGIALTGFYCLVGGAASASAASLWLQLGLLALALSLPVALTLRRLKGSLPQKTRSATAPAASVPGTRGLVISYGIFGFGYILPATFLPVLARAVVDEPRLFGLAWPVFGAMAAVSTLMAGWLMRHASRLQVWAVSHALMGVGVLLPSLWSSAAAIGLSALLVGGTFMVITMAGVQEIRSRATGDATALVGRMTTAFAIGQIAGPVASSLVHYLPGAAADGLNLSLQAGAAALLFSAAWLWRQHRQPIIRKEALHAP